MANEVTNATAADVTALDTATPVAADNNAAETHAAETHAAETHANGETVAAGHGGDEAHVAPSALGFDASMLVALAMLVVIALAIWKKVPAMIGAALDKQIAAIQEQLDAATKLRADAEAIKAEYLAKSAQADSDAQQMKLAAETEAQQIIAKAKVDAADMVTRRGKMAEDKIAAAEASAIADVRAKIAGVSAIAAEQIIAGQASAATDAALIDQAISALN